MPLLGCLFVDSAVRRQSIEHDKLQRQLKVSSSTLRSLPQRSGALFQFHIPVHPIQAPRGPPEPGVLLPFIHQSLASGAVTKPLQKLFNPASNCDLKIRKDPCDYICRLQQML